MTNIKFIQLGVLLFINNGRGGNEFVYTIHQKDITELLPFFLSSSLPLLLWPRLWFKMEEEFVYRPRLPCSLPLAVPLFFFYYHVLFFLFRGE